MGIRENLKLLRKAKGYSTYKVAEITGISQPVISKIENGKRSPDMDLIAKIAKALEFPVSLLYADKETIERVINEIYKASKFSGDWGDITEEEKLSRINEILAQEPSIFYELDENVRSQIIAETSATYGTYRLDEALNKDEFEAVKAFLETYRKMRKED